MNLKTYLFDVISFKTRFTLRIKSCEYKFRFILLTLHTVIETSLFLILFLLVGKAIHRAFRISIENIPKIRSYAHSVQYCIVSYLTGIIQIESE